MFVSLTDWMWTFSMPNVGFVIEIVVFAVIIILVTTFFTRQNHRLDDKYTDLALDTHALSQQHYDLIQKYHNARAVLDVVLKSQHVSESDQALMEPLVRTMADELEMNLMDVDEVNVCGITGVAPLCIEVIYSDGATITLYPTISPAEDEDEDETPAEEDAPAEEERAGSFAGIE